MPLPPRPDCTPRGYNLNFGSGSGFLAPSGISSYANPAGSRRNTPTKSFSDTMSWLKGPHLFSFGGSWTQVVNLWDQVIGTETIPQIYFRINSADPIHSGDTDIFTNANFPNASQSTLDDAAALYANLTGRVGGNGQGIST